MKRSRDQFHSRGVFGVSVWGYMLGGYRRTIIHSLLCCGSGPRMHNAGLTTVVRSHVHRAHTQRFKGYNFAEEIPKENVGLTSQNCEEKRTSKTSKMSLEALLL